MQRGREGSVERRLTLVHDVLLQGLRVVGHGLVQVLQQLAHAGHWDAERLDEQQQLLGLQVLQRCGNTRQLYERVFFISPMHRPPPF